jgi:hypothetical protein
MRTTRVISAGNSTNRAFQDSGICLNSQAIWRDGGRLRIIREGHHTSAFKATPPKRRRSACANRRVETKPLNRFWGHPAWRCA